MRYDEVCEVAGDLLSSPPSITVALEEGDRGGEWAAATEAELQSLWENEVYDVIDRPPRKKVIGTK